MTRQPSFMQDVTDRIKKVQGIGVPEIPIHNSRKSTKRRTQRTGDTSGSEHAINTARRSEATSNTQARSITTVARSCPAVSESAGDDDAPSTKECRISLPSVSFCRAIVVAIALAVLLACAAMFTLMAWSTLRFKTLEVSGCNVRIDIRRRLIQELIYKDLTKQRYESMLTSLKADINHWIALPADRAVNSVWGHMLTEHHSNSAWEGKSESARREIAYREWVELTRTWTSSAGCDDPLECGQHVTSISAGYDTGQFAGLWLSSGCRRSNQNDSDCSDQQLGFVWDASGPLSAGSSTLTQFEVNVSSGERGKEISRKTFKPAEDPALNVQRMLASDPERRPLRAWSKAYQLRDSFNMGITWTAPISYCGKYKCMKGAVGASIRLEDVSFHCRLSWEDLSRSILEQDKVSRLTAGNSAAFVVNQMSYADHTQVGLLLAASDRQATFPEDQLTKATESPQHIVSLAARVLLARYGSWDSPELLQQVKVLYNPVAVLSPDLEGNVSQQRLSETMAFFNFSRREAERNPPVYKQCEVYLDETYLEQNETDFHHADCFRVGATSLKFDERSRWLAVLVLPGDAFGAPGRSTRRQVDHDFDYMQSQLSGTEAEALGIGGVVVIGAALIAIALGSMLGMQVSKPLHRLSWLMKQLGNFDFSHDSQEWVELHAARRSRIRDVRELQDAFRRLSRGTEAFARFVPETVVQNIIHGHKPELDLQKRRITIMNSDIEGFTAISEKLELDDLLCFLCRYLSVMTHIIEICEGVVSEIQGDGLVVFWNSPDDVEEHAFKACAAALAQQHAIGVLYPEFSKMVDNWNGQQLNIRIGIHTGEVLSGNIGSTTKMKFGCLGEAVKIAADLQESCKSYGAKVIISGDTHSELNEDYGCLCRRIDLLQLKGDANEEKTWIYEVIGREGATELHDDDQTSEALSSPCTQGSQRGMGMRRPSASLQPTSCVVSEAIRRSTTSLARGSGSQAPCLGPMINWLLHRKAVPGEVGEDNLATASARAAFAATGSSAPCRTSGLSRSSSLAAVVVDEGHDIEEWLSQHDADLSESESCDGTRDVDRITFDQRRRSQIFEEALDSFHCGMLERTLSLAETLKDDEAAAALVERVKSLSGPCERVATRPRSSDDLRAAGL